MSAFDPKQGPPLGEVLQPAPHTRAIVVIDVAELALEIGFLAATTP